MGFKPVNKEEMNKTMPRISVNLELIGDRALQFKALTESIGISGKDLLTQMTEYCLDNPDPVEPKK